MLYSAFGLGIAASHELPRLAGVPKAERIDVRLELNARPPWFTDSMPATVINDSPFTDEDGVPMRTLRELANGWLRVSYVDGTDFILNREGSEVWATWPSPMTVDEMSSYLLGPVMGFLLRLRGRICLHASSIVAGGRAMAVAGPSEAGKSTTAAAFAARGHAILSDDVVPLAESAGGFDVLPGYPRVRLWPSSLNALASLDPSVPVLPPDWGDRRYHLDIQRQGYTFQSQPVPLGAIYVLQPRVDSDDAPYVTPLTGEEGVMALVTNSFASTLIDRAMRAQEFDAWIRVLERVRIRAVRPHADPKYLPRLCDVILEDFLATADADRTPAIVC